MPINTPFQQTWIVTVNRKGQITLPTEVRKHLQIDGIHTLAIAIEPNGMITLQRLKYPTLASLAGVVPALSPPKTWEEIKAIVADERAEAHLKKQPRHEPM